MSTTLRTGRCHCGQVEWTVKLDRDVSAVCHCKPCQKVGSRPYNVTSTARADTLTIVKGQLRDYVYIGDSGKPVHLYHCANCTTHAYMDCEVAPGKIDMSVAPLEGGGKDLMPELEIYGREKLPWLPELAKTYEGPSPL
ncbi:MAG: hypothetical protein M1832_005452 [Thelocarpon impressellum]|nr:MAG: hypothetical protein M1832_005452 [Thelocarpon impressellum]